MSENVWLALVALLGLLVKDYIDGRRAQRAADEAKLAAWRLANVTAHEAETVKVAMKEEAKTVKAAIGLVSDQAEKRSEQDEQKLQILTDIRDTSKESQEMLAKQDERGWVYNPKQEKKQ